MKKTPIFKDKQLLVKTKTTLFGESAEKTGETVEVEVISVGAECVRYVPGDTVLAYKEALQKIQSDVFKDGEFVIESESVGRGVVCKIEYAK